MAQMWEITYRYLKMTSSDAISLRLPPTAVGLHRPLVPDASRRGRVGHRRRPEPWRRRRRRRLVQPARSAARAVRVDRLSRPGRRLAATVLPGLIIDITTFPAREVIYWAVIVPAWNLYLLARRALVMAGFAMPKPAEISPGLTTLGQRGQLRHRLGARLTVRARRRHRADHRAVRSAARRPTRSGLDHAYPRGIVRDLPSAISRVPTWSARWAHLPPAVCRGRPVRGVQGLRVDRPVAVSADQPGGGRCRAGGIADPRRALRRRIQLDRPAVRHDRATTGLGPSSRRPPSPQDTAKRVLNTRLPADQHLGARSTTGFTSSGGWPPRSATPTSECPTSTSTPTAATPGTAGTGTAATSPASPTSIRHSARTTATRCRARRRSCSTPTTTARRSPTAGTRKSVDLAVHYLPGPAPTRANPANLTSLNTDPDVARSRHVTGRADHHAWHQRPRRAPEPLREGGRPAARRGPAGFVRAHRATPSGDLAPGWTPTVRPGVARPKELIKELGREHRPRREDVCPTC
jgi:hypothetical protein